MLTRLPKIIPSLAQALAQWLFRFGRDERLPIVLTQRRIFILPTAAGFLYAAVLSVMLIGAINYNLGLGHALVFLLFGLGIVSMVHAFRNLLALRLAPGRADPVFLGETAYFTMHIENTRNEARRALELSFGRHAGVRIDIPAREAVAVGIPRATEKRGRLDPGRITLATRYPLGLFRAWSYPHPPLSCLVYPKPLPWPLPPPSPAAAQGAPSGESGHEDFVGLRQWQAGDPIRHIAWKAAARDAGQRPLLVKQFGGSTAADLWLDWSLTPDEQDTETRLSILAGWVLAADAAGARYGLRLPGRHLPPDQGGAHRASCLETLALHGDEAQAR